MNKRPIALIFLLMLTISLLAILCACTHSVDVSSVLEAALDSQTGIPDGKIYLTSLPEDDPLYLDSGLAGVLWGNGAAHPAYELTASAAVFLPARSLPFEIAVLECLSTDSASDVALMCCDRADILAQTYPESTGAVSVCGRYVIFTLCPSPEAAQKAARQAITHPQNSDTTQ